MIRNFWSKFSKKEKNKIIKIDAFISGVQKELDNSLNRYFSSRFHNVDYAYLSGHKDASLIIMNKIAELEQILLEK